MDYQPRPGSLAARVCAWFKANPNRSLMASDICARFGATSTKLSIELGAAEDADYLLSDMRGRSTVYSAGPKLSKWQPVATDMAAPEPQQQPARTQAPATAAKIVRARLPRLDISQVTVHESGLLHRVRGGPGARGTSAYSALFDKLQKPNTWLEIPSRYVSTINKALVRYRKEHPTRVFRCVKFTDTHHQLQRLDDRADAAS